MNLTKTKKIIIAIVAVVLAAVLTVTVLITTGVAVEPENKLFNDGLVPVRDENGRWGYINLSGGVAVNFKYSEAGAFNGGVAIVAEGEYDEDAEKYERYKIINNKDKCVNDKYYAYLAEAGGDGLIIFKDDLGFGIMNREGKIVVDANYDDIEPFSDNGYAIVTLNGKKGVINKKGELVVAALYDDVEGLSYIGSGDYYAFIAKTDKVYSDDGLNETGDEDEGEEADAQSETQTGGEESRTVTEYSLVNLSGRVVSSGWLGIRQAFYKGDLLTVKQEIGGVDLYGFITVSGRVTVVPTYTETGLFMNGLCAVKTRDELSGEYVWNYVDKNGNVVINLNDVFVNSLNSVSPVNSLNFVSCFAGDGDIVPVKIETEEGVKYRYMDRKGHFVTEAIYDGAYPMGIKTGINKYALAYYEQDGKIVTHLINKKGEVIDLSEKSIIKVLSDKIIVSYSKDGKTVYAFTDYELEVVQEFGAGAELLPNSVYGDGYIVFKKSDGNKNLFGIMSKKGKVIIEAKYTAVGGTF